MKLFIHYCSVGFGNCYIMGTTDAIIIDPGHMDRQLLEFIEINDFLLKAVLVTHDHKSHVHGLKTLKQIYNTDVFAINRVIQGIQAMPVKDGDRIDIGPFNVEVIAIPGHSADSVVYRIGTLLFTGDVLTTGLIGTTDSAYGAKTQINNLRSRILSLPGDYTVLPGHGPPSTLEAERRYNAAINTYDNLQNRKPGFKIRL